MRRSPSPLTERWLYPVEKLKWSLLAVSWEGRWEWAWVAVGGFYLSLGLASEAIILPAMVARFR